MKRAGAWLTVLGVASLAACTAATPLVPGLPGSAQTWIFAVQALTGARGLADVEAVADSSGFPFRYIEAADSSIRLHALAYAESMEELGLEAGAIPAGAACARRCALTAPRASFVLDYTGKPQPGWQSVERADPDLMGYLVPDHAERCDPRCLSYHPSTMDLGSNSRAAYFLSVPRASGADGVFQEGILGLLDGSLFRVGAPGSLERLCRASSFHPSAGTWRREARELWVSSASGQLATLSLETVRAEAPCPYAVTATLPPGSPLFRMESPPGGDGSSFLAMDVLGNLSRWRDGTLRPLGAVDLDNPNVGTNNGVLIDLGDKAVAAAHGDDLAIIRGDQVTHLRRLAIGPQRTRVDGALVLGSQLYISLMEYDLFRLEADQLIPVDEGPSRLDRQWADVFGLSGIRGRIVGGTKNGLLGEWQLGTHYCPLLGPVAYDTPKYSLNIQDHLVWIDTEHEGDAQRVLWMSPDNSGTCPTP
ncbi:MAG: hypothetical protein U1E65_17650 [Myxococcota bacterium]